MAHTIMPLDSLSKNSDITLDTETEVKMIRSLITNLSGITGIAMVISAALPNAPMWFVLVGCVGIAVYVVFGDEA